MPCSIYRPNCVFWDAGMHVVCNSWMTFVRAGKPENMRLPFRRLGTRGICADPQLKAVAPLLPGEADIAFSTPFLRMHLSSY
jgi:hypothetical protein